MNIYTHGTQVTQIAGSRSTMSPSYTVKHSLGRTCRMTSFPFPAPGPSFLLPNRFRNASQRRGRRPEARDNPALPAPKRIAPVSVGNSVHRELPTSTRRAVPEP